MVCFCIERRYLLRYSIFSAALLVSCNSDSDKKEQQTDNNIELEGEEENLIPEESVEIQGKRLHPKFKVTEYCDKEDQDSVMFYLGGFGNKTSFNMLVEQENSTLKIKREYE